LGLVNQDWTIGVEVGADNTEFLKRCKEIVNTA
jgi:hypothetical protein